MSVFLFAGEPSGDGHGADLMTALRARAPQIDLWGVGGPKMRQQGLRTVIDMESFAVMGFSAVIAKLPGIVANFFKVRKSVLAVKPDGIVLIDYPGFNLRLARSLRNKGYSGTITQYISPSVWAHGRGRIDFMARYYDQLLTIFPFEKCFFDESSLHVEYVGNPLVRRVATHRYDDGFKKRGVTLALFPGSRLGEVKAHFPLMLATFRLLKKKIPDLCAAVSCASDEVKGIMVKMLDGKSDDIDFILSEHNYDIMRHADIAIAKSGTVTLELALHKVPTAVIYHVATFNRFVAKYILRLKMAHYCIVNILTGKTVFPEFIEEAAEPQSLVDMAMRLLSDATLRNDILQQCEQLAATLGNSNAADNAAAAILLRRVNAFKS